jgi:glycosyltransferase involved in cell wall biosynthesis
MAPPYRVPLWRSLAGDNKITVWLLESDDQLSADGNNRGSDWSAQSLRAENFLVRTLRTFKLKRGEHRYYLTGVRSAWRCTAADIVMLGGWESPAYWLIFLFARLRRVPVVGFYESILDTNSRKAGPVQFARAAWFKSMDAIVTPGPSATEAVLATGTLRERIFEGFNAVDVEDIWTQASRYRLTAPTATNHRFLFIGQLIARKNVLLLIEAFAALRRCGSSATLRIAGVGELEEEVTALISAFHLNDCVAMEGYVDSADLPALLATSDTLVMPSLQEVWGLVVNEALAAGLHVVITENAGVTNSVRAMKGVHVAHATSSHAFAATLRECESTFTGVIDTPEILSYGPGRFANIFREAFDFAIGRGENASLPASSDKQSQQSHDRVR